MKDVINEYSTDYNDALNNVYNFCLELENKGFIKQLKKQDIKKQFKYIPYMLSVYTGFFNN